MEQKRVDWSVIQEIPAPPPTDTWRPLAHGDYVLAAERALNEYGLEVVDSTFTVPREGLDMFGTLYTSHFIGGKQWALGLRNSNRKALAAGVCAGLNVLVCENLVFHGEVVLFRKHTSGLTPDVLDTFIREAITVALGHMDKLVEAQDRLARLPLTSAMTEHILVRGALEGAFKPSALPSILGEHLEAETETFGLEYPDYTDRVARTNAYMLYQAITRTWRTEQLFQVHKRSTALEKIFQPLLTEGSYGTAQN